MTARLQRSLIFIALTLAITWAAICLLSHHAQWSGAAAVAILAIYPLVLALELTLSALIGSRNGDGVKVGLTAGAFAKVRAWARELVTGTIAFGWQQPFRANAELDHLNGLVLGHRGVVFVHGLVCNRGFWNPLMKRLRLRKNVAFIALNLEPIFGSIDAYLGTLEAADVRITAATGLAPVLVCHSMGGLVARRWLADQCADARVHRVITIGTPHSGTWLARFSRMPNAREMAIGSSWLAQLRGRDRPDRAALFTCFYSDCDNVVFPALNATLPGADNRRLHSTAHVELAFRPEVMQWLLHFLEADARPIQELELDRTSRSPASASVAVKSPSDATRS